MAALELDDETAVLLKELAEHEHISPAQLLKNLAHWSIAAHNKPIMPSSLNC